MRHETSQEENNEKASIDKRKNSMKYLKKILDAIPDVIKVYKSDYTIAFYNEAGYRFYDKTPEEVENKKYYSIAEKSIDCYFEKVLKSKKMISLEKYIPECNRYMDVCFNPVLGDSGEVIFVVERLRDITEKKILNNILKDSEKRYQEIINIFPEAIIIVVDNIIVLANSEACKLIMADSKNVIGMSIYNFFPLNYAKTLRKKFMKLLKHKDMKIVNGYKLQTNNNIMDAKIYLSCILYKLKPAIQIVISDITEMKKELNRAADIQKNSLQEIFPITDKVNMEKVYIAAQTVSGDYFRIYKVNDNLAIGILIDASGHGISAALNISALEVLFNEEILANNNPMEIIINLNKKLVSYFCENYIAACCFSMDFIKNEMKIVGAGINKFIFQQKGNAVEKMVIKGPFLGMFQDSKFDEQIINFRKGDRFFLFTDGLEFIVDEDTIIQRYMGKVGITQFKNYITEFLEDTIMETGKLEDDCTLLGLEVL